MSTRKTYGSLGSSGCRRRRDLVLTGGVGEHSSQFRSRVMPLLKPLGLFIDEDRNQTEDTTIRTISTDGSRCPVLVVPYDEERAIAEATAVVVISDDTANRSLNQ
ncbi:hypothetical protein [Arthrobacter sp. Bi83]|uniref:hypothetical protein n=1 Tax=Arthrobacter sp. Bi83 TaxID=2822353 RepID=UPI0033A4689D